MRTTRPRKSVCINVRVWYVEEAGQIYLSAQDVEGFHAKVSNKPDSVCGHPTLFAKLVKVLKDANAPHPRIDEKAVAEW